MKKLAAAMTFASTLIGRITSLLLLLVALAVTSGAQSIKSATDGQTPLALEAGAPAGSYALSGFDNVNLYNGSLNFNLPLLHIGGRGSAQMTMTLPIEQKWRVLHFLYPAIPPNQVPTEVFIPLGGTWSPLLPEYGPGVLVGRRAGKNVDCGTQVGERIGLTLTRLTFIASDGTEYELRDQLTEGMPYRNPLACSGGPPPPGGRGSVFVSADGSAMTFVSCLPDGTPVPVDDGSADALPDTIYPSGFLMLRDGTRFRIDAGVVSWLRDRNGNMLTFTYNEFKQVILIKDSLNREVTVSHWNPVQNVWNDTISFKGFAGAARTIKIWHALQSQALRNGSADGSTPHTLLRMSQLFPEIPRPPDDPDNFYDQYVISAVELPDARQYRFFYNSYGELARVELPTGGAFEYDYTPTSGVITPSPSVLPGIHIYRRVIERRVYPDGQHLEQRITYNAVDAADGGGPTSVDVRHLNLAGTLFAHVKHYFHGSPKNSFALFPIDYPAWKDGKEYLTESYDFNGAVLRSEEQVFEQRAPVSWWSTWREPNGGLPDFEPPNDVREVESRVTMTDVTPNLVAKQRFGYDEYSNKTDSWEYDFGQGAPPAYPSRHSHTDYISTNPVNGAGYASSSSIHLRSLPFNHSVHAVNPSTGQETEASRAEFEYDRYDTSQGHALLADCPNISGHDTAFSLSYNTRGNLTATKRWLNTENTWITIYQQFDMAGNVVRAIDPRGYATVFDHTDRFGSPDGEARSNLSPQDLFSVGQFSYAFATSETNPLAHTSYTQYDYHLGVSVDAEDANGIIASARYDDLLDRPSQLDAAVGTSLQRRTVFSYDDPARAITTRGDQNAYLDGLLKGEVVYDGLGRQVESRQYETVVTYIKTIRSYDALGRASRAYNPHRTTSDQTYGWTDTSYDALSRVRRAESFDKNGFSTGAVVSAFSGNATTVTDQAGKARRSVTDGLGRLIRVDEPDEGGNLGSISAPVQPTSYSYSALDNVTQVNQGGQIRQFIYDSLSRLREARNPEQVDNNGVMQPTVYTYDNASNLLSTTDPNLTAVSFTYDQFNRVQTKALSTGGVWTYSYDTGANGKGRIVSVTKGSEGYFYDGYDALGRVTASRQITNAGGTNQTYTMSYGYDLAGHLTSQIYPSGKEYKTAFDNAGRIGSVSRYINQAFDKTYASQFQYAAHGGVSQVIFGNNKMREAVQFNSRLQTERIELYKLSDGSLILGLYAFGAANNNGDVLSQTIRVGTSATITQSYAYDSLNRLSSAQESVPGSIRWTQTYGYDRYGNRTTLINTGSEGSLLPTQSTPSIDAATNRLIGFGYDSSGNVKTDAAGNMFDYDAESHQTSFNSGAATYSYDGEGRRVKKVAGLTTTVFVYNGAGQLVAEYTNGSLPSGGTSYLMSDNLRSTRVVTDSDGNVKARHDYLPFGEEIGPSISGRTTTMMYGATDSTKQRFTGHERDTESGLDFMQARYCSTSLGRFTSPDPTMASVKSDNPQSWNRYVYVLNNPLAYIDPLGLWDVFIEAVYEEKDGKKVLKEIRIWFIRSKKDDNAQTLIKQLNLNPKSKQAKFIGAAFAIGADKFRVSQLGKGTESQVYSGIEKILTHVAKHGLPAKSEKIDCSLTACNIGFGVDMGKTPGTLGLDELLKGLNGVVVREEIVRGFSAKKNIAQDDLKVGDIVRWAKGEDNKATHFANFIYTDDNGVPVVFSKSGVEGRYEYAPINDPRWSQKYDYGSIRGIGTNETGFYRPRR